MIREGNKNNTIGLSSLKTSGISLNNIESDLPRGKELSFRKLSKK
jgi:hypothetical protein